MAHLADTEYRDCSCWQAASGPEWRSCNLTRATAASQCSLTPRSSRAPTAWHASHQALGLRPILRLLSGAPHCRCRLNSNVRHRQNHLPDYSRYLCSSESALKTKIKTLPRHVVTSSLKSSAPCFASASAQTMRHTSVALERPSPHTNPFENKAASRCFHLRLLRPVTRTQKGELVHHQVVVWHGVVGNRPVAVPAVLPVANAAVPNPSFKPSPNGVPRGPGRRYAVHFRHPGPRVTPLVPA